MAKFQWGWPWIFPTTCSTWTTQSLGLAKGEIRREVGMLSGAICSKTMATVLPFSMSWLLCNKSTSSLYPVNDSLSFWLPHDKFILSWHFSFIRGQLGQVYAGVTSIKNAKEIIEIKLYQDPFNLTGPAESKSVNHFSSLSIVFFSILSFL